MTGAEGCRVIPFSLIDGSLPTLFVGAERSGAVPLVVPLATGVLPLAFLGGTVS
jgi:hypothetical protein